MDDLRNNARNQSVATTHPCTRSTSLFRPRHEKTQTIDATVRRRVGTKVINSGAGHAVPFNADADDSIAVGRVMVDGTGARSTNGDWLLRQQQIGSGEF